MCSSDKEAKFMGINSNRLKIILLICASLIIAVCVSISGIIAFIGLVVVTPILIGFMFTDICPIGYLVGTIPISILNPGEFTPNSYFYLALGIPDWALQQCVLIAMLGYGWYIFGIGRGLYFRKRLNCVQL